MYVYNVIDLEIWHLKGQLHNRCEIVHSGTDEYAAIDALNDYVKNWNNDTRAYMKEYPESYDGNKIQMIDNPMDKGDVYENTVLYYRREYKNGDWYEGYIRLNECYIQEDN